MIEFMPINPQNNYEAIEDDFIKGLLINFGSNSLQIKRLFNNRYKI